MNGIEEPEHAYLLLFPRMLALLALGALAEARVNKAALSVFKPLTAASTVVAAADPRVLVSGRSTYNADGVSRDHDWEGVAFTLTVNNTGSVYMNCTSTSGGLNRVITHVQADGEWYEQSRQWVVPGANMLLVAANLYQLNKIRVFFELEPAFSGTGAPDAFFSVHGFVLDAGDAVATAPLTRRIEVVGDSISAGYGSMGIQNRCPVRRIVWLHFTKRHLRCVKPPSFPFSLVLLP